MWHDDWMAGRRCHASAERILPSEILLNQFRELLCGCLERIHSNISTLEIPLYNRPRANPCSNSALTRCITMKLVVSADDGASRELLPIPVVRACWAFMWKLQKAPFQCRTFTTGGGHITVTRARTIPGERTGEEPPVSRTPWIRGAQETRKLT